MFITLRIFETKELVGETEVQDMIIYIFLGVEWESREKDKGVKGNRESEGREAVNEYLLSTPSLILNTLFKSVSTILVFPDAFLNCISAYLVGKNLIQ